MKKIVFVLMLGMGLTSCAELFKAIDTYQAIQGITEGEAVQGLKEALQKGVSNGTSFLGDKDGFLKNAAYKVLLPEEVREAEQKIRNNVLANALAGPYLDQVVTAMNRGAENAMTEAKPIFVNAIKEMTITDAINIVKGGDGSATDYLMKVTSDDLRAKFAPVIKTSLDEVNVNDPWTKVTKAYNMVMAKEVETDLNNYVTDLALKALFSEIRKEENDIRTNTAARTTDMLKKVFDYADTYK